MAAHARITANRIDSQNSTGPKTPEGKAAVAQNRTTHGRTGEFRVLSCEDQQECEVQPRTATGHFLVRELAQAQWRVTRAAIEAELLEPCENPTLRRRRRHLPRQRRYPPRDGRPLPAANRPRHAARPRSHYRVPDEPSPPPLVGASRRGSGLKKVCDSNPNPPANERK